MVHSYPLLPFDADSTRLSTVQCNIHAQGRSVNAHNHDHDYDHGNGSGHDHGYDSSHPTATDGRLLLS